MLVMSVLTVLLTFIYLNQNEHIKIDQARERTIMVMYIFIISFLL